MRGRRPAGAGLGGRQGAGAGHTGPGPRSRAGRLLIALPWLAQAATASAEPGPPQPLFSDTQLIERSGTRFEEPGRAGHASRHVVTFQHFDAWAYGRNFFFFDTILPWGRPGHLQELYGEAYSSLSLGALSGHDLGMGLFKDVALTFGLNLGASTGGAGPLVFLPGATVDLDVPGFSFVSLDVLAFIDRGRFAGAANDCRAVGLQLTASWQLPYHLGPLAGTFEGYADLISGRGACAAQVLSQPQLRVDLGRLLGHPQRLFLGVEVELWWHKYGIDGLSEIVPRSLVAWRF